MILNVLGNTSGNVKEKTLAQRKKHNKEIKNLTMQNKNDCQEYEKNLHGDIKDLLPGLNSHPTMKLAMKSLNPEVFVILEVIYLLKYNKTGIGSIKL